MLWGRPRASLLRQVESYLKYMGMTVRLPGQWPDGGLSEGYEHDGPGVCVGDGQTKAIARWTWRRAAPAYVPIPDLIRLSYG